MSMEIGSDFFARSVAHTWAAAGSPGRAPMPGTMEARGFAKYQEALKDLPKEYSEPDNYPSLVAWLEANPVPYRWARRKAKELMAESKEFRDLGMDLDEATHWLKELAVKWKKRAEQQMADQLPDSIGGNSGLTPEEVVGSLSENDLHHV